MLPPFDPKTEFKCPHCGTDLSFWTFQGCSLDQAIYDKEYEQRVSWEVKTECLICGKPFYAYLWVYDLDSESKFEKERQGL